MELGAILPKPLNDDTTQESKLPGSSGIEGTTAKKSSNIDFVLVLAAALKVGGWTWGGAATFHTQHPPGKTKFRITSYRWGWVWLTLFNIK